MKEWPILVIEADWAAQKPVKAPRPGEPVIPSCITLVAGCIGLDALGKPVSPEWVHRCDLFTRRFCTRGQRVIDREVIRNLILHPRGLFQNAPDGARRCVILNKTDSLERGYDIRTLAGYLEDESPGIQILGTSLCGPRTIVHSGK